MTIPYTRNDVSLPQWSIEGDSIVIYNVQMGGKEWDFRIQKPGSEVPGSFQLLERDLSDLVRLCTDNLFASFSDNPVVLRYTNHLAKENRSVEALDLINPQTKHASTSYADNDRMLEGARRINQIVGGNRTIFSSEEDLRYTHPTTPPVNPTPSASFPRSQTNPESRRPDVLQSNFDGRDLQKSKPKADRSKTLQSEELSDDGSDLNLPSGPIPDQLKAILSDIKYQNLTFGDVVGKNNQQSNDIKNQIGELVCNSSNLQYAELKEWIKKLTQRTLAEYCKIGDIDWGQVPSIRDGDKDQYRAHLAIQLILVPLLPSNGTIKEDQLACFIKHIAEYLDWPSLKRPLPDKPESISFLEKAFKYIPFI